ncbi:MAG: hypothetical protein H0X13_11385 [Ramlibacter sp.]|nr:hypothetical protein [Ramlibacter sp.]
MVITWRQWAVFAAGLLFGIVAGALVVLGWPSSREPLREPPPQAGTPAVQQPVAPVAAAAPAAPVPPVSQVAQAAPRERTGCPARPAVAAAGKRDGQFHQLPNLSGKTASDVGAFIVLGKEAAAAGRPHDAEVAFMMSCQLAHQLSGPDAPQSADAKYQLGRHYSGLALHGSPPTASRDELLRRAQDLYTESLQVYQAKYGDTHEKSRFAAAGLAALQRSVMQAQGAPAAPPAAPAPQAPRQAGAAGNAQAGKPPPRKVEVARVEAPTPSAPETREALSRESLPTRASPSFDCAKARSVPEKLICGDAELARLDRDLGRLHARAKSAALDDAAFKRRNDQEWRRREATCRDRDCLLRWYAERRNQLLNELNDAQPTASR